MTVITLKCRDLFFHGTVDHGWLIRMLATNKQIERGKMSVPCYATSNNNNNNKRLYLLSVYKNLNTMN